MGDDTRRIVHCCVYMRVRYAKCIYELEECMANLQLKPWSRFLNPHHIERQFPSSKDAPDEKGDNPIKTSRSRRIKTADKAAFDNRMLKFLYSNRFTFLSDIHSISLPSPLPYMMFYPKTLLSTKQKTACSASPVAQLCVWLWNALVYIYYIHPELRIENCRFRSGQGARPL